MSEIDDLKHQIAVLELRLRIARLEKELADLQSKQNINPRYETTSGTWTSSEDCPQTSLKGIGYAVTVKDGGSTTPHSDTSQNAYKSL